MDRRRRSVDGAGEEEDSEVAGRGMLGARYGGTNLLARGGD
jgi:hypothetical protein